MKTRLFVKPYCGWCTKAIKWLDAHGVDYETIDVLANKDDFQEMVRLSNQEKAPVIEADGKVLADFGPEELERFWNQHFANRQ